MNAHQVTVTPEFSYSEKHNSRFMHITFRSEHPKISLAKITRKSISLGSIHARIFPSVNKINIYTLHGPSCDIDIPLESIRKAFEEKRPVKVKFLNSSNQLISSYFPISYIEWIVNGELNHETIDQHHFGNAEEPFVIDLINKKESIKHVKNSFVYISNMQKSNQDFDFLYYG
jgi:hypothetical protein